MVKKFLQLGSRLRRFLRQYRVGLTISGVVCLLSVGSYIPLYLVPHPNPLLLFLHEFELRSLDMRFRLRGRRPPSPTVVIVAIDQKSQDLLGRWPFPRSNFARAVDFLREAGARVVTFDVNFPQPDENSALMALRQVRRGFEALGLQADKNAAFDAHLRSLEADADNDKKFADSLARFENAILGYFFLFQKEETLTQDQERVNEFLNYLSFQAYPQVIHPEYGKKQFEGLEAVGVSPNLPAFALVAKNFGYFNVVPDSDGTVRREPVLVRFQDNYYPSLDIATYLAYTNMSLDQVAVVFNPNGLERIDLGPHSLPVDPAGYAPIDYYGPAETFPTVSLAAVVQRTLPLGLFRDRIVLIGPTATGIADMAVTPFQQMAFPGVEVHANFIDNLLRGSFIRRGLRENLVDLAFLVLFSLVAGVVLSTMRPGPATRVVLYFLGVFLWLAYYLFAQHRVWIAVFSPTATLIVTYASIISYRILFEEREKKKVRGAFQQYVPPGLISQLLERPELLRLGGEEKPLTAMFSDIRGFTTLSEGLSPTALVELLNEYLSAMTEIIFHNWGTLDKYIGDAIMAFWGAPYPQTDHALRACRAALQMVDKLLELQADWAAQGRPRIDIGVGINTGPMLVGNMGSSRRFNFTVMGDNVNLASRLEGINKQFGTRLIISEGTFAEVRGEMVARELDLIRVKGKLKPVRIYELLGTADQQERFQDLLDRFQQGLAAYRSGNWEQACAVFGDLLAQYPHDAPSQILLERCRRLAEQPPEGEWDGVYVMKTK
jgi:adenylate cyclase